MTDPPPADDALLTIGAFARASRLSVKALRLYDELGLLPPARVDERSGYRYYAAAQWPAARLIALLRELNLPLADIRTLLDAPEPERPALLRTHWDRVRAEYVRRASLFRYLQHHLQGDKPVTDYAIRTRQVPAQSVATLTFRVLTADLPRTIDQGLRDLHAAITAQHGTLAAAPFVIYHGEVNADSDGPIEICQPYSGTLTPSGTIVLREEPAHHEAFVTLSKGQFRFPAILSAYDALADHARKHGQSGPLACREIYPHDWDRLTPDDPAGEVAWPYTPGGDEA